MNNLKDLINKELSNKYQERIKKLLRFGRLPTHEAIKVAILELGENLGYKVWAEVKVGYKLKGWTKKGRIDAAWFKDEKFFAIFEVDEGIDTRSLAKLYSNFAEYKFFVMFDVKKMMQRRVNSFNFTGITPIKL